MTGVYLKSLLEKKWMILSLLIFTIFFIWLYVSIFKSIAQVASLEELLKILPEKFIKSMNIDLGSFNTLEGFIGNEKFSIFIFLMTTILSISLSGVYLSGEIEKGTIYLPLSLPLARIKIYLSKFLAGVTAMIFFSSLAILSVFPLARLYDITIKGEHFLKLTGVYVLFGLTIFAFSMLVSAIFSEKSKVALVTSTVMILMYVAYTVSNIKDSLDFLKYYSIFHYFNIPEILIKGTVSGNSLIVLTLSFILFTLLGLSLFNRRDIVFGN